MADLMKQLNKLTEENKERVSKYVGKLLTLQRLEGRLNSEVLNTEREVQKIDPQFVEDLKGKGYRCSFCGKYQNKVDKLIAGPNVYICNECIDLCSDILLEEKAREVVERSEKKTWN